MGFNTSLQLNEVAFLSDFNKINNGKIAKKVMDDSLDSRAAKKQTEVKTNDLIFFV